MSLTGSVRDFAHFKFKTKMSNVNRAFTLIELLVVIAVIALLVSVVLVALNSTRLKARNVRRVADIKQLVTAFNLGFDAGNSLPSTGSNVWVCLSTACYGGWSANPVDAGVDAFITPYIKKPADPFDSTRTYGGYLYNSSWTGGNALYDGSLFPPGAYITFMAEPPFSSGICGSAKIWDVQPAYVQCTLKLD